jgi:hypothetical protein
MLSLLVALLRGLNIAFTRDPASVPAECPIYALGYAGFYSADHRLIFVSPTAYCPVETFVHELAHAWQCQTGRKYYNQNEWESEAEHIATYFMRQSTRRQQLIIRSIHAHGWKALNDFCEYCTKSAAEV